MFWWFLGGMFVGALLSLFFLAICNAWIEEENNDNKNGDE